MTAEQAKIGTRVRSTRDFAGVPKGTEGVIDEEYRIDFIRNPQGGVMVAWDLPDQPLPKGYKQHDGRPAIAHGLLRDGFDKVTELHWLEVIE